MSTFKLLLNINPLNFTFRQLIFLLYGLFGPYSNFQVFFYKKQNKLIYSKESYYTLIRFKMFYNNNYLQS